MSGFPRTAAGAIVVLALSLAVDVLLYTWAGYVLLILYNWLIQPMVHLHLTLLQAIAIQVFLHYLFSKATMDTSKSWAHMIGERIGYSLVRGIGFLITGFVVSLFM